jgi:adenylate cyclase class 2
MATRRAESVETEVKIAVRGARIARTLLRAAGFGLRKSRVFEANVIYDTPDGRLRGRQELLRIRTAGRLCIVTFKGKPLPGPHKSRPEYEFEASSADSAVRLLNALGYAPAFRYEKYRAEYERRGEPGHATLDETPIGTFLELEGPPDWIDRSAARLGFSPDDYITLSYASLYAAWRCETPSAPPDMIFASRPRPRAGLK